jgi:hypothetical protein
MGVSQRQGGLVVSLRRGPSRSSGINCVGAVSSERPDGGIDGSNRRVRDVGGHREIGFGRPMNELGLLVHDGGRMRVVGRAACGQVDRRQRGQCADERDEQRGQRDPAAGGSRAGDHVG